MCGGGNADWRRRAAAKLDAPAVAGATPSTVLSTLQTAASSTFMGLCSGGGHLFMIADEVHRMGAIGARRLFELETGARLGLKCDTTASG